MHAVAQRRKAVAERHHLLGRRSARDDAERRRLRYRAVAGEAGTVLRRGGRVGVHVRAQRVEGGERALREGVGLVDGDGIVRADALAERTLVRGDVGLDEALALACRHEALLYLGELLLRAAPGDDHHYEHHDEAGTREQRQHRDAAAERERVEEQDDLLHEGMRVPAIAPATAARCRVPDDARRTYRLAIVTC